MTGKTRQADKQAAWERMAESEGLLRASCPPPFGPCFARSNLLPAILYYGLSMPFALRAVLRTFKIAPGDFVEHRVFIWAAPSSVLSQAG